MPRRAVRLFAKVLGPQGRLRLCLVWLLAGWLWLPPAQANRPDESSAPRVLLLASYGFGRVGVEAYIAAFQRRLVELGLPPSHLHVDYLDLEGVQRPDVLRLRQSLLEAHIARHRPDMLVTLQQPALDFALTQLPQLVAETPLLAAMGRVPEGQTPPRGVVLQLGAIDAAGTLEQAMALFPATKRVLAVVGNSPQDQRLRQDIEAAAQTWDGRVAFSYTDQLSVAEVEHRVARLPPGTLVLIGSFLADREGNTVVTVEWATRLAQLASVPVFSLFREVTPSRMVGGSVIEFDQEAQRAADRVWAALSGRRPWPTQQEDMPLQATPVYNWPEVLRWGADPAVLPDHTRWIGRPESLWVAHRSAVIAIAVALAVLLLAVAVLVRQSRQRRSAVLAAQQSEARLRVLIDHSPDGLLVLDTETGVFIDANPAALALFGARRDQIVGARPVDLYLPDQPEDDASAEAIARNNARVMAGERLQLKRWIKTFDGAHKICRVDLVRLPDAQRALVRSSFTDITELAREREALRVSEERWHFALEGAGAGVWDLDLVTQASPVSRRFCEILGYTLDEYVAHRDAWRQLVHPEDLPRIEQAMRDYLDGRSPRYEGEYRMRCKDGQWKWVEALGMVVSRDAQGRPLRIVGTMTDITTRRQSEASLQLASMVYRYSAECMMVGTADGELVAVNHAFTALLGYTEAEAIGTNVRRFWVRERCRDALVALDDQLRHSGSWRGNLCVRAKSGAALEVQMSASTISADSPAQTRYVALFSDVTEQRAAQRRIWEQAHIDDLTGLPNRRQLTAHIDTLLEAEGAQLCVLGIDLDHFKTINDSLGREVADRLLCEAAQRLRRMLRGDDIAARLSADEFVVVLGTATDEEQTHHFAGQVVEALREPFVLGEHRVFLSASVGVALAPAHGRQAEELLRHAGQALGSAKLNGRDRYSVYTADLQALADRHMLVARDLREAVQHGQLQLHYQPIVSLASGQVHKAEALLRWSHPAHPGIGPAEFIPIAEQAGLIVPIGDWVFAQAVTQVAQWQQTLDPGFQVSINRSPAQFNGSRREDEHLMETLLAHAVSGSGVVMEITEGLLLDSSERVRDSLARLRAAGIGVSIDDFGTGYSSLAYVQKFAIDYIKIDRSFVRHIADNRKDLALCEAIIAMAHKLDIRVIAEGIETREQWALLREVGCDYGQGYWFSRPLAAPDFEAWHRAHGEELARSAAA